jgi:hypothetical protein
MTAYKHISNHREERPTWKIIYRKAIDDTGHQERKVLSRNAYPLDE